MIKRDRKLVMRVTPEEKDEIRRRATSANMTMTGYILHQSIPQTHQNGLLGALKRFLRRTIYVMVCALKQAQKALDNIKQR